MASTNAPKWRRLAGVVALVGVALTGVVGAAGLFVDLPFVSGKSSALALALLFAMFLAAWVGTVVAGQRKPIRTRAFLVAASLLLALVVAELALRVPAILDARVSWVEVVGQEPIPPGGRVRFRDVLQPSRHDEIVFELRPDLEGVVLTDLDDMTFSTNSMGFRAPEPRIPKPEGMIRIVGLGDSFAFGWKVADGEPYLDRLGAALRERHPEREWEIVNTGVPGYNTVQEAATLREKVLDLEPDLVLLGFVGNDTRLPQFLSNRPSGFELTRSYLVDLVGERLGLMPRSRLADLDVLAPVGELRRAEDPALVPERYRDMVGWAAFEEALDDIAAMGRDHGFPVVAMALLGVGLEGRMLDEAAARDLPTLKLEQRINAHLAEHGNDSYVESALALAPDDNHPSALMHGMIAEELLLFLDEQGLLRAILR